GPHYPTSLRGPFATNQADRFAEPRKAHRPAAGSTKTRKPVLLDPSYTIIDEPDADPTLYGTRVFGINESGELSGQYMDSAGQFHAFVATPNGDGTFQFSAITVKGSDTFSGILNDKGETLGTYVNKHTGVENGWALRPGHRIETFAIPEGTGGTIVQW